MIAALILIMMKALVSQSVRAYLYLYLRHMIVLIIIKALVPQSVRACVRLPTTPARYADDVLPGSLFSSSSNVIFIIVVKLIMLRMILTLMFSCEWSDTLRNVKSNIFRCFTANSLPFAMCNYVSHTSTKYVNFRGLNVVI